MKKDMNALYGKCAMATAEESQHLFELNNRLDPLIRLVMKSTNNPEYFSPFRCSDKAEMASKLLNMPVSPFEFATIWNNLVSEWADHQLTGMTPVATIRFYDEDIHERVVIAWDDFGDLQLHSPWGLVCADKVFDDPDDMVNFRRMVESLKYLYDNNEFKIRFTPLILGYRDDVLKLVDELFQEGFGSDEDSMIKISMRYRLDWEATQMLRRELRRLEDSAVG